MLIATSNPIRLNTISQRSVSDRAFRRLDSREYPIKPTLPFHHWTTIGLMNQNRSHSPLGWDRCWRDYPKHHCFRNQRPQSGVLSSPMLRGNLPLVCDPTGSHFHSDVPSTERECIYRVSTRRRRTGRTRKRGQRGAEQKTMRLHRWKVSLVFRAFCTELVDPFFQHPTKTYRIEPRTTTHTHKETCISSADH